MNPCICEDTLIWEVSYWKRIVQEITKEEYPTKYQQTYTTHFKQTTERSKVLMWSDHVSLINEVNECHILDTNKAFSSSPLQPLKICLTGRNIHGWDNVLNFYLRFKSCCPSRATGDQMKRIIEQSDIFHTRVLYYISSRFCGLLSHPEVYFHVLFLY